MILLILFAFFAGIVTILSPCILPILPIILSSSIGGKEIGKARPLGVVTGFITSFTFFTLFLSTIVRLSNIPADSLRLISVVVIALLGFSFLVPQVQLVMERLFSKLAGFTPQSNVKAGFWPGVLVGLSLGLLWTPCVGPILASVISLAITGTVTLDALLITFAYSIGTAIPMFLIMMGGQQALRKVPWLLSNSSAIQKGFGIVMIITAIGIFFNVDRQFQTYVIQTFPQYGVGLTKFEDNEIIRKGLQDLNRKPQTDAKHEGSPAPEISPGGAWINTDPLRVRELKGKVVIIDFWTYSCINCQRTLPYLKKWHEKYKDKGLVIIGVHSPEFEFEKSEANVRKAVADFGITYPVVQDNDFVTWRVYDNRYWPAKYFIDKDGYIRYTHFGEGAYDESEKMIQTLLAETGRGDVSSMPIDNPKYTIDSITHETYLGYGRMSGLASPEQIVKDGSQKFTAPKGLSSDTFALSGAWTIMPEYANPQKGSKLFFNFEAKEVYLVMRSKKDKARVRVLLDGKQTGYGEDVKDSRVIIDSDRLYKLIKLPTPGRHILELQFEDNNAEIYAFTFG